MQTFIYPSKQRTEVEASINLELVKAIKIVKADDYGNKASIVFRFDKDHREFWIYDSDEDMIYDAMHKLGDACPEWVKPEWGSIV